MPCPPADLGLVVTRAPAARTAASRPRGVRVRAVTGEGFPGAAHYDPIVPEATAEAAITLLSFFGPRRTEPAPSKEVMTMKTDGVLIDIRCDVHQLGPSSSPPGSPTSSRGRAPRSSTSRDPAEMHRSPQPAEGAELASDQDFL